MVSSSSATGMVTRVALKSLAGSDHLVSDLQHVGPSAESLGLQLVSALSGEQPRILQTESIFSNMFPPDSLDYNTVR